MKKIFTSLTILLFTSLSLVGCDLFTKNSDNIHKDSYEPITGKFILYEALDTRYTYTDTYFIFDGNKGNFSMKYYENGFLKREGSFERIVAYEDYIGKVKDNLHFNIKTSNNIYEHIGTYTESFSPINQFRILEEYHDGNNKYYLSENPYVMGTYIREGETYKKESSLDSLNPTIENFTTAIDGTYKLDDDHYFYFLNPKAMNGSVPYMSYFQYYSSILTKPIEGFVDGKTYVNVTNRTKMNFTFSRELYEYKVYSDTSNMLMFGYYSFDKNDRMVEHYGTVNFVDNELVSFSFEYLSRNWTDEEWDKYTKDQSYSMPDAKRYDFIGGTYSKI